MGRVGPARVGPASRLSYGVDVFRDVSHSSRAMRALRFTPVAALLLAAACVNVHATRLGSPRPLPPVHPEDVWVYQDEDDIEGEYDRVAVLFVDGDVHTTNQRQMIRAARKKAGRLGANAIVLGRFRDPSTLGQIAAAVLDVPLSRRAEFLAVRVESPREP